MKSTLLADRIYQIRTGKRMRQKPIAEALEVNSATYSRMEKGERNIREDQLPIIARVLGIETDELKPLWLADRISDAIGDSSSKITEQVISLVHNNKQ